MHDRWLESPSQQKVGSLLLHLLRCDLGLLVQWSRTEAVNVELREKESHEDMGLSNGGFGWR
jgi:hypothetical protein